MLWKRLTLIGIIVLCTQAFPFARNSGIDPESPHSEAKPKMNTNSIDPEDNPKPMTLGNVQGAREAIHLSDPLVLVNKHRYLPSDYVPADLVQPNIPFSFTGKSPKKLMRKEAAQALEKLFNQAKIDHMNLVGVSAYRSYVSQNSIFNNNVKTQGEEVAITVSAVAGYSEHQTGLAIDISTPKIGSELEPKFGEMEEGIWLARHAPKYGFIIRYPKGKEQITGYTYEPWHIRYVGIQAAEEISVRDLTLEEYLSAPNSNS